jgi:putative molybdopterin biosynthesis protein
MSSHPDQPGTDPLLEEIRRSARQEQFLEVISAEEARRRFEQHLDLSPLPGETVSLQAALGRVLSEDLRASGDVPPFDRASVDGFAVRASDTAGATQAAPHRLMLNGEVLACGRTPRLTVSAGTATAIATGAVVPRGADAVVMIEHTELIDTTARAAIDVHRAVAPGQFVSYAGSDISRGETLLRQGTQLGSREIGMVAACGLDQVVVVRRPKIAVLSTGDELVPPGEPLGPAAVYDSNGAILAAAVTEAGGEPLSLGALPDDQSVLRDAVQRALAICDMVVLSGGTSKGAGDLSYEVISELGRPGILVHGVAIKPGKPLCLAVVNTTPIAVLPGFPTSAIFTFQTFVAPVIRARAGLPPNAAHTLEAHIPVRIASELGRKEFVLVALLDGTEGLVAFPSVKGSGSVTTFSQADGFLEVDALSSAVAAGSSARVTLLGRGRPPDLVVAGSHCIALEVVLRALAERSFLSRTIALGSLGGVAAASRGECDLAPVHLLDPETGIYNEHVVGPGMALIKGWQRMQGIVHRRGDPRFEATSAIVALKAALSDRNCIMVNRNAGSGTRILIDRLLEGARPAGYGNQPRSHNAVAAAVAQGRADWGVAIASVAGAYNLGFLPLTPEDYDFLLVEGRRARPPVQTFLTALNDPGIRERIRALGMAPFAS